MGGKFWLGFIAALLGIAVGGFLVFILIEGAFLRWGALGAILFLGLLTMGVAAFFDRRDRAGYDSS